MNLRKYFNKHIILTFTDGEEMEAYVETYTPKIDSEKDLEEIGVYKKNTRWPLIEINEKEIKCIKILSKNK